jgi:hypothetical protein
MPETYASLDKQIAEIEDSLRAIEERISEFAEPTAVPLDVVKSKRKLEAQLAGLRARRHRLQKIPCPYRGLEYFDVAHAANYFGRTAMVEKLVDKLKQANFVAVVGPSGCGKSSLVRAGLLPALTKNALPNSSAWQVEVFRPGDDPLRALATALVNRLAPDLSPVDRLAEARKLADGLRSGALPVADVLAQLRAQYPDVPRLLLIADQFEEAFTLCADDAARRAYLDTLLAIAETPWATVLFTLRADFYRRVLESERFGRRVDAGLVNVLPMSREERREAVEQPALRAGCHFEEGLVERILDAVEDAPGDLPLLEFALTELWERQTADGALTHAAYDAIGEVRGAIAKRADEAIKDLDAEQTAAVRAIFTRLVQVTRPDEAGQDARRRVDLDELPPESQALAQRLADARLLVTGRDPISGDETIEVAHEALIRGWGQLQEWLNRDREFLLWRQRLRTLADIWEESGRSEGALLRDALLREAQVRSEGREGDLSALERAYIAESAAAAERAEQEAAAARQRELEQALALAESERARAAAEREKTAAVQRELEQAQALAEAESRRALAEEGKAAEQARSARRLRSRAWALGALLVLAVAAAGVAFWFFRQATENERMAQGRRDQMRVLMGADVARNPMAALWLTQIAAEWLRAGNTAEAADTFAQAAALDPTYAFVNVPAGEFTMGSAEDGPEANDYEKPQHRVDVGEF